MTTHICHPGPLTGIDQYINTGKCLECGLDLYYPTKEFNGLGLTGQRRVMGHIAELQNKGHKEEKLMTSGSKTGSVNIDELHPETRKIVEEKLHGELPLVPERPANLPPYQNA